MNDLTTVDAGSIRPRFFGGADALDSAVTLPVPGPLRNLETDDAAR